MAWFYLKPLIQMQVCLANSMPNVAELLQPRPNMSKAGSTPSGRTAKCSPGRSARGENGVWGSVPLRRQAKQFVFAASIFLFFLFSTPMHWGGLALPFVNGSGLEMLAPH